MENTGYVTEETFAFVMCANTTTIAHMYKRSIRPIVEFIGNNPEPGGVHYRHAVREDKLCERRGGSRDKHKDRCQCSILCDRDRMNKVRIIYNLYGYYKGGMAGSVFDAEGIAPALTTMTGGG